MSQNFYIGNYIGAYPVQQISDKFSKCQFAIETADQYNPTLVFDCIKAGKTDQIAQLAGFQKGDAVKVHFDVVSRKSKDGKWYTSVQAWKVERIDNLQPAANTDSQKQQGNTAPTTSNDLPF